MKPSRIIISTIMALGLMLSATSCGIFAASDEVNPAAQNATVESGIYVSVNTIMGKMGRPIYSYDGYNLHIQDGKASSYLPFFGEVYSSAGYGTEGGIKLKDCPVQIVETQRKGMRIWSFVASQGQETFEFILEFSDSGMANLSCRSNRRSLMRYSGTITEAPER